MNEAQLILALQGNQSKAFDDIFGRLFPELCYYANNYINNPEDAKDLVADSLGKFWMSDKRDFTSLDEIRRNIFKITKHTCIDFLRREQMKMKHHFTLSQLSKEGYEVEIPLLETEILKEIFDEIERLPQKCKQVFKLSYLNGLKRSEIAKLLKLSENTVKNHNAKALQTLRLVFSNKELVVVYLIYVEMQQVGFQEIA